MDPYVGEIRMFGGTFAPLGWAMCNGQLLPISDYETLYTLLGTTYGGDGQTNFGLPNLQGRVPLHLGSGFQMGQMAGEEQITLKGGQLPMHNHSFIAKVSAGTADTPVGNLVAAVTAPAEAYNAAPATSALAPASISPDGGGGQPHDNMQPYQCVSFIIALNGIWPSQG